MKKIVTNSNIHSSRLNLDGDDTAFIILHENLGWTTVLAVVWNPSPRQIKSPPTSPDPIPTKKSLT